MSLRARLSLFCRQLQKSSTVVPQQWSYWAGRKKTWWTRLSSAGYMVRRFFFLRLVVDGHEAKCCLFPSRFAFMCIFLLLDQRATSQGLRHISRTVWSRSRSCRRSPASVGTPMMGSGICSRFEAIPTMITHRLMSANASLRWHVRTRVAIQLCELITLFHRRSLKNSLDNFHATDH